MAKYNIDRISGIRKAAWNYAQKIRDRVEKRPFPKYRFEKLDLDLAKKNMGWNMDGFKFCIKPAGNVAPAQLGGQGGGNRGNPNNANFGNLN